MVRRTTWSLLCALGLQNACESAYHRDTHVEERTSNSEAHYNWRWKKLWRCKVPPKVWVFWWRVSNEFVPSRYNQHRRHVEPLIICTTCGAQPETTYHGLLQCTYARQFWRVLADLTSITILNLHPTTWTTDVLDDSICSERERGIILCGMWSLWCSRNDQQHGKASITMKLAIGLGYGSLFSPDAYWK
jgi:hypothetical protein